MLSPIKYSVSNRITLSGTATASATGEIRNEKRPLQLRSLPEILFNSAAMVTAKICAIPRNACKSLPISDAQRKRAQPMLRSS
jgi:hypothetical protein